jgi:hypothetical protein
MVIAFIDEYLEMRRRATVGVTLPGNANAPTIVRPGETLGPDAYPDVAVDLSAIFAAAREGAANGHLAPCARQTRRTPRLKAS